VRISTNKKEKKRKKKEAKHKTAVFYSSIPYFLEEIAHT
jgi:hypothetical protein